MLGITSLIRTDADSYSAFLVDSAIIQIGRVGRHGRGHQPLGFVRVARGNHLYSVLPGLRVAQRENHQPAEP